jgi:hypothetical protein
MRRKGNVSLTKVSLQSSSAGSLTTGSTTLKNIKGWRRPADGFAKRTFFEWPDLKLTRSAFQSDTLDAARGKPLRRSRDRRQLSFILPIRGGS